MLKAEHLLLSFMNKGLLYLCPSSFTSSVVCHPPPLQPRLPNHHLCVFFHTAPCALNKSPLSIRQSFLFFVPPDESHPSEVHFPLECLSFWISFRPWHDEGIHNNATFPWQFVSCKHCQKASSPMSRPFPFGMPVLEKRLLWVKDTEMVWDLSLCPS